MQSIQNVQNTLSKLNQIFQLKKDQIKPEQIKEAEQQAAQKAQQLKDQQQQHQQQNKQKLTQKPGLNSKNTLETQESQEDIKQKRRRRMKILRKCAGDVWEDATLLDWPDNDYRLFCGNLGNEVSDEMLAQAFRKYASFARSRVIRDKRTMKTRGYGFVSFLNPNDYLRAFKEMNGKYVGNRPIKILKGKWAERSYQKKKADGLEGRFIKPKIRKIKRVNLP